MAKIEWKSEEEIVEEKSKLTSEEINEMAILELAMVVSEMKGGN